MIHKADVRLIIIIFCSLIVLSCSDSTLTGGAPIQYPPEPTIDSLVINVVNVSLSQQLDTSASCSPKGWNLNMSVSFENRNLSGSIDGIYIWGATVLLSDSEAFVMYFIPVWNGSIPYGETDTLQLATSVSRPCMDRNFSNQIVSMFLLWTDTTNVQRHLGIDSVTVLPRY